MWNKRPKLNLIRAHRLRKAIDIQEMQVVEHPEQTTKAKRGDLIIRHAKRCLCPFDGHVTVCVLIYIGGGTPKI